MQWVATETRTICKVLLSFVIVLLLLMKGRAEAAITIDTVMVGNAGNANDGTGYGSVSSAYQIGQYEVTAGQYTAFLNAVAATDTYGLYNSTMWSAAQGCKIQQSGSSGSYTYSVASEYANRPVNFASWGDAARFANWMHNGQPTGTQSLSTTEDGSYYLNGANTDTALMAVTRKTNATWVIPTRDEWYKSAYHKNDGVTGNYWAYPTRVNSPAPGRDMTEGTSPGNNANYYGTPYPIDSGTYYTTKVGEFQLSKSAYGTFDQGGNVYEWSEWSQSGGTTRGADGAGFGSSWAGRMGTGGFGSDGGFAPTTDRSDFGLRLAVAKTPTSTWKVGTPIVSFFGGHDLDATIAQRDVAGGYNVDWGGTWNEVSVAGQYGLRTRLRSDADSYFGNLLQPESLDGGTKQSQLNALIDQYKTYPSAYAYYLTDEPTTQAEIDRWAPLINYLRTRDPGRLAYLNMGAPSWTGDTLWQHYIDTVHPQLLSYDYYNLTKTQGGANYDEPYYLSNLGKVAGWAKANNVPFMNTVQAWNTFDPSLRIPTGNELRFLANSTLAYGAQGISYWMYYGTNDGVGPAIKFKPDGTPTEVYTALAELNPEFVEVAKQYQPLTWIGTYLKGYSTRPPDTLSLPGGAPFTLPNVSDTMTYTTGAPLTGILMGFFGPDNVLANATRLYVANLDYSQGVTTTINGPSYDMATFNAATKTWTLTGANSISVSLPAGGGILVGVGAITANNGDTIDVAGNTVTQAVTINGTGANCLGALRNSGAVSGGGTGLTVTLGSNSSIGVTGAGSLTVGNISGDYSLTKVGSGSGGLVLSGTNSYTGGTIVNAGILKFNSTSAIPSTGTTLINSGGALLVSGAYTNVTDWLNSGKISTASTGALALAVEASAESINMGSYTNLSLGSAGPYTYTYSGTMTPANNTYRFGGGGGTLIVSSTLNGSRSLVASGNLILTGSNSYTGGTTVNAGYLKFNSTSALPSTGTTLINSGGALLVSGVYTNVTDWLNSGKINTASTGALALAVEASAESIDMGSYTNLSLGSAGPYPYTYSGTMTPANNTYRFGGGGGTLIVSSPLSGSRSLVTSGNVTLTGSNTYAGTTTINAGTLQIGNNGTAGTLGTGSVTNNATLAFNRADASTVSNAISGSGSLSKTGAGRLTLSGNDTYTGATNIFAGTLAIGGSGAINSTSDITLDGGTLLQNSSTAMDRAINFVSGTFGGTGTYAGNISPLGVHLAPGDGGIGTLTIAGSLSLYADGVLDYDFGTTAGTSDLIAFSGSYNTLVLDGTINISCSGTLPVGQYTIFSGATTIKDNGLVFGNVPAGHSYSYTINGGSVIVTAAPEPGTLAILSAGLLTLMGACDWRKRRCVFHER